jgi:cysteine desulfurase/selenocysteine lyase
MIDKSCHDQKSFSKSTSARPGEALRAHMPVCQRFAYFDHAAVAPLPDTSAAAITQYASEARDLGDTPWMDWSSRVEALRHSISELVNATADEIALIPNTTTGIGLVAEGWRWQPGDSLVVPANEFPSNLAPWRQLKRRGVEVREVPIAPSGKIDLDEILAAIDGTTRIVALSWVGFVSGWRIDVSRFCEAIHRRGALVFLDAIQGLGAFPLDVNESQVDFCAADGHKWMLGPEGAGMLYIRAEHLDRLDPLMVGWHSLDERQAFDPATTRLKSTAARYEGGSANMVGLLGLERSVRLLLDHGAHKAGSGFASALLENVANLEEGLKQIDCEVVVPADEQQRSGILTVGWRGENGPSIALAARKFCLSRGIVTSVRAGRLRASTHAYNNSDDTGRLIAALSDFKHGQHG